MIALGLIGAGAWGKNYITTLKRLPGCRLKYICDQQLVVLKSWQKDYVTTTRYNDFYKFADLDGVIIATPARTHFALAREFLKRGYAVLVEKPVALQVSQALKLKQLQQKTGLVAMVGHTYLYTQGYQQAKAASQNLGPMRRVEFVGLNPGPAPKNVSVLWEWGPHGVAVCSDLVGKPPVAVRAGWFKPAQAVRLQLKFSHPVQAVIKVGWGFGLKQRRLTLVGARGKFTTSLSQGQPLRREVADFVQAIATGSEPRANLNHGLMVTQVLAKAAESLKANGREMRL